MAFAYWVSCWIGELCAAYDANNTRASNRAYSVAHGIPHGDCKAHTHIHGDTHVGASYNHNTAHGDTTCNLHGTP